MSYICFACGSLQWQGAGLQGHFQGLSALGGQYDHPRIFVDPSHTLFKVNKKSQNIVEILNFKKQN